MTPLEIEAIGETPGFGIEARWEERRVTLGRPAQPLSDSALATELAIDGVPTIIVRFADTLRLDAAGTIAALRQAGVAATILSGDRPAAVAPVARILGLTAQTGMTPQDKLAAIARQAAAGHKVLMIGDGLNDGPALVAGYASIAPGSASDAGTNAADCIFLGDRLMPVMQAIRGGAADAGDRAAEFCDRDRL